MYNECLLDCLFFNVPSWECMCDILTTFQINEDFQKVIMHNDVTG